MGILSTLVVLGTVKLVSSHSASVLPQYALDKSGQASTSFLLGASLFASILVFIVNLVFFRENWQKKYQRYVEWIESHEAGVDDQGGDEDELDVEKLSVALSVDDHDHAMEEVCLDADDDKRARRMSWYMVHVFGK